LNIHSPFFFRHIETIASEVLDQVPLDSAVVAHHVDDMLKFRQYAVELSDAFRWVIRTGQIETFLIVQVLAKLTHFNSAEFLQNTYDFADLDSCPSTVTLLISEIANGTQHLPYRQRQGLVPVGFSNDIQFLRS